jgi:hypothetical protein
MVAVVAVPMVAPVLPVVLVVVVVGLRVLLPMVLEHMRMVAQDA